MNSTATTTNTRKFQINNMMSGDHDMVVHASGCSSANSEKNGRINNTWTIEGEDVGSVLATECDTMNEDFGPGTFTPAHFHVMPCAKA